MKVSLQVPSTEEQEAGLKFEVYVNYLTSLGGEIERTHDRHYYRKLLQAIYACGESFVSETQGIQFGKPAQDDALVDRLLALDEDYRLDCKRLAGRLTSALETIVAFANTDGGFLLLGLEDTRKAKGRARVYGAVQRGPDFFLKPDAAMLPALGRVSAWATGQHYERAAVSTFLLVATITWWPTPLPTNMLLSRTRSLLLRRRRSRFLMLASASA